MPALRQLARRLAPGAPITSRPKPSSLRHHASSRAVGRPGVRTLARAPTTARRARAAPGAPTRVGAVASPTQTPRRRRHRTERELRPSGEKRGWLAATASPTDARLACRRRTRDTTIRDTSHGMSGRSHSCHASVAAVGRPRGVPRVVGVRDAHRPRRPVERHGRATSHASSRSIAHATSPRTDTPGATPGRRASALGARCRRPPTASRRPSPAATTSSSSLAQHHPPPSSHVGGDHDRRRRAVERAHHEVGAAVEAVDPGQPSPAGDQRGSPTSCERASMAAVMRGGTAPDASRRLHVESGPAPATRLAPGGQLASGRARPPSWSSHV